MKTQEILTVEELDWMSPNMVFGTGEFTNDEKGIPVANIRPGDSLLWIAKTGGIGDWAIYYHWKENGEAYVMNRGDKLMDRKGIRKLVPCTDEAYERYRF